MAENETKPTDASVEDRFASRTIATTDPREGRLAAMGRHAEEMLRTLVASSSRTKGAANGRPARRSLA